MAVRESRIPKGGGHRGALCLLLALLPASLPATEAEPPIEAPPDLVGDAPVAQTGENGAAVESDAVQTAPGPAEPSASDAIVTEQPAQDSREALLARRDAAHESFLRLMDEKRYDEAATVAEQVLDLSTRVFGEQSVELASPLTNLATAQMNQGDLAGAETRYLAAIALIERAEGIVSPRLANPLVGLGETYMRGGFYQQANDAYARALRVNHAASGFYNLEQTKILDGLSESYLGLDKLPEANAQQRTQVAIRQRRAEAGETDELVEALYKLGRWYNRTGQYLESREAYQAARRLLRETQGPDDPSQADALLGEAETYLNEGAVPASASALKRALELLDRQPERDPLKRAEVLVALGDLYTITRQFRSARQRYVQAWDELSGDDALLAQREEYFMRPKIISSPRLPVAVGSEGERIDRRSAVPGGFASGTVLATLTVTADGDATNALIVESAPAGLLDRDVLRAIDATAFRPRMVDGSTVASEGVQFRHDFRYPRPSTAAGPPEGRPEDGTGDKGKPIGYPGGEEDAEDAAPR